MKGKCYSQVNRGQRKKSDLYQTPGKLIDSLFENVIFDEKATVLEPCIGEGEIILKLFDRFKYENIYATELMYGTNFFNWNKTVDYIITNPPFSLANEFIIKAKKICEYKFAFLMKLNYLQGQWRYNNIYNIRDNFPLTKIFIYTRMPTLELTTREDGKYNTGMQAMAWYIWEKSPFEVASHPIISWIDSSTHTVKKSRKKENDIDLL